MTHSGKVYTARERMFPMVWAALSWASVVTWAYAKTRDTYVAYRKAGYSKKFREEHDEEILLHQAAKNAFDDTELVYVTVVILQDLFHGPGVTGAGRLDHCKGQRLLISGLLHSAIPLVSLVLMVWYKISIVPEADMKPRRLCLFLL